jgi:hypothetical protein
MMQIFDRFSWRALTVFSSVAMLSCSAVFADSHFEQPSVTAASSLLPADVIKGPNHTVRNVVHNDGFLNIYDIDSKYGPLRAVSTATLHKRIGELNAMAGMEKLKGTEEFMHGITDQAGKFVEGGVGLITHPVESVSGAVSGVASLFRSVGGTLHYGKSETESGRLSVISGFDKTKREYAAEYDVDVYSRNHYLQTELNDISRAGFLGKSIIRLGGTVATGGAGIALSVTGSVQAFKDLMRTKSAGDLRILIQDKLEKIGVSSDLIEVFIENRNFTLSQQTALVLALDGMSGTANRVAFIKFAALTDNDDIAAFRTRQALMYAAYNRSVAPLPAFDYVGQFAVAHDKAGVAVVCAPLDRALWTRELSGVVASISNHLDALPDIKGKSLFVTGSVSALTRQQMEKWGWTIKEHSLTALAKK